MGAGGGGGGVKCYGPVTQQGLLVNLGIASRLDALVRGCTTEEDADRLISGCERLVSGDDGGGGDGSGGDEPRPAGMGIRYKAIAMVSKGLGVPVGFQ